MKRILVTILGVIALCGVRAEETCPAERGPHPSGEFNVALDTLGATDNEPLLLKLNQGKNTITLTSNDGLGVNLDFLVLASPDKIN